MQKEYCIPGRDTSHPELDSKSFFYTPLDKFHRSKKIYKHVLGTDTKDDQLIFEETDDSFSVSISLTSDEKFFVISTSDSDTIEETVFDILCGGI